jgi:alkylation response protein AidB-like acyl-CoA dehydrogenase
LFVNFDFSDEQELLRQIARDYLEANAPLSLCRSILESDAAYSTDLWKGVAEMGWLGTAVPEAYGGSGFGYLELAVVAEEIGRALAPIPFSSSVCLATEALLLAGTEAQKQAVLPRLASGEWIGTFALSERPGQSGADRITASVDSDRLTGRKLPVPDGDVAQIAVVVAWSEDGPGLFLVELDAPGVTRQKLACFDGSRSQARLDFANVPAERLGHPGEGRPLLERLLARAAILLAFEQLGGATRAFETTLAFAMERYAFGRPIGSFQAIKHQLADLWCDLELSRCHAYYGAWALCHDAPELEEAACLARASASEVFTRASEDMIEIHGGVGFTWEYDCHLFLRRARLLAAALGGAGTWRHRLVDRVRDRAR